jgi:alpha-1,2-mannosyltransferase
LQNGESLRVAATAQIAVAALFCGLLPYGLHAHKSTTRSFRAARRAAAAETIARAGAQTDTAVTMPSNIIRGLILLLGVVFIVGLGVSTAYRSGPHQFGVRTWGSKQHRTDFTVCLAVGQAVLDGTDIYEAHNIRGWYYLYPPLFAILMAPFALMSVFGATLIWYLLSVAMVIWSVKMCVAIVREVFPRKKDLFWLYALPPLLILWPLMSALTRGQTTPLILWLVVAAVYYHWKRRGILGGMLLGCAALLKIFPVLLLAYFVWRRQWRFVAAMLLAVVTGALLMPAAVFGWQRNIEYLRKWNKLIAQPVLEVKDVEKENVLQLSPAVWRNQSLQSVLWRLTGGARVREVAVGIGIVMAAAMVLAGGRPRTSGDELMMVSAFMPWMLLISPIAWAHYFMLLLLPLTTLSFLVLSETDRIIRRAAQTALIIYAVLSFAAAGHKPIQFYGPLCWGALGLWVALMTTIWRKSAGFNAFSRGRYGD